jgi:collagenase-like PrtC family protease
MKIKFHLPDFALHYHFNRVFIAMMKHFPQYFHEGIEIASIYGTFPQSLWNGGRIVNGVFDKNTVKTVVREFNKLDIPLRFTFTNPTLTKEDLNDDFCNFVLKTANNGKNGVIVVSPILEEYIRTKYPDYTVTSSTCKRITDVEKLSEEVEKSYDIVVLDYDFNNKFEILEKIQNKEKCEILVNACCQPNCSKRSQHYEDIGNMQRAICKYMATNQRVPFDPEKYNVKDENSDYCQYMRYDFADSKQHPTHISPSDIFEKYIPMGFNQFKIEGRTLNAFTLAEYYLYYMVKPEFLDKARMTFYCQLIEKEVISSAF